MTTTRDARAQAAPAQAAPVDLTKAGDAAPAAPSAEAYARAARRMRRGERLVTGGFVVAVVGIVGYCAACLAADLNQDLGASLLRSPGWLVGPALGVIGLGTLMWLVGSFDYLSGAMDSDPDAPLS